MPWVPLHESGVEFTLFVSEIVPNVPVMVGSTITYQAADQSQDPEWLLEFSSPTEMPVRIVTQQYIAGSNRQSAEYHRASISWNGGAQDNEAPPYPSDTFTTNDPVSDFWPNPLELDAGIEGFSYFPTQASTNYTVVDEEFSFLIEVWVDGPEPPPEECNFNCECDDEYPTRTLAQMREFLMIRLGWAAMKDTPLPGVVDTLNAFLQDAQEQLHAEYRLPRMERFFTWDMSEGVRFYDLPENQDLCTKKLDPRQLTWIGISDGCDAWRPLVCGIPPESYYSQVSGIPTRYEIRQCIEVWPPPSGDQWKLRIKGYFYNESLSEDEDVASVDYQAVQLFALANAKAHYGQPDAPNIMRQAMRYIGNMTAGSHHTRRYVPGTTEWVAPPLPILTGYPGDP